MSNYEFLTQVLGLDGKVCWISEPYHYQNGNFSVEVTDSEGWAGINITFDKDGNVIDFG